MGYAFDREGGLLFWFFWVFLFVDLWVNVSLTEVYFHYIFQLMSGVMNVPDVRICWLLYVYTQNKHVILFHVILGKKVLHNK